jgi:hypothetical protein
MVYMTQKADPTKDKEFKRVLGNLLKAPPKPHSEMKLGKKREPGEPGSRSSSRKKQQKRD